MTWNQWIGRTIRDRRSTGAQRRFIKRVYKVQINGWKMVVSGGVFSKDTLYNGAGVGQMPAVRAVLA
jgi:hypothetical protein